MIELHSRLEGLSPQKRELLLRQLRQLKGEAPRPVIQPRGESLGDFPLSYAQQRLWFLDQLEPGNPFYNIPGAVRLTGPLDEAALAGALSAIVRRHEALRTTFPAVEGRPVQRVNPPAEVPLPTVDLSALPEEERRAAVRAHTASVVRQPLDLAAGPLIRFVLLRLDPSVRVLAFALHHIVSDAWSMRILLRELTVLYHAFAGGAPSPLPDLPVQYADYAIAERSWLDGEALGPQLAYWRQQLADLPGPLELPTDRPRPEVQTFRGARQGVTIPLAALEALRAAGQEEKTTPFMALFTVFAALLHRYTGRHDLVVGTPIANRDRVEVEGLIGLFVNTLALRSDLSGDPTVRELLARTRAMVLEAFAHPDLPFERLVEDLHPDRDLARTPVFQVLFAFQSMPVDARPSAGLSLQAMPVEAGKSLFDLTLTLEEMQGRVAGFFEYNTDLFKPLRMRRMAAHFEVLLAGIASDPERRLSALPLLSEAERHQVSLEWSDSLALHFRPARVHELIAAQVERTPEAVAVSCGSRRLTYRELDARAGRLAGWLARQELGPDSRVGICLERSLEMVVALLGVWRAGLAYVPMDPSYPEERLAYMLDDAGISLLLADAATPEGLRERAATIVHVDEDLGGDAVPLRAAPGHPEHLAYIIYTSGSTGRPKGVEIPHAALVNFLESMRRILDLRADDALLAVTSLSFDIAALELFLPLTIGARIELASREVAGDGPRLLELLRSSGAKVMQATPVTWQMLIEAGWREGRGLKVLCGGEALPEKLAAMLCERSEWVWNLYGPTETTIWSAARRVLPGERVAIGPPVGNTSLYVLDAYLRAVPAGIPGEIWIAGEGLARGYRNRPELTAERFLPDPFAKRSGARLYGTGDLARFRADGAIEFLGRADHQVKVRGFRIELGEIEVALESHPAVERAVVTTNSDGQGLSAWIVSRLPVSSSDLRAFLRARLPEYMVPSALIPLDHLPLTPNGKVDRRALAALRPQRTLAKEWTPPRTPTEEILARIWERLLKAEGVGAHDSFFDLGGHSLLATQMISRVREAFALELPLRALFEAPTVAGLAARIETARAEGSGAIAPPLARVSRQGRLPLSFGQQRLWFLDQLEPGSTAYNIPWAVRLEGRLDSGALAGSLSEVARRHEALRTVFHLPDGADEPVQRILQPAPLLLPLVDLAGVPDGAREMEARRLAVSAARRTFDLSRGPLLRAVLLRLAAEEHVLVLTLHHIISDGWSMGVLVREVAELYDALAAGRPARLPELPVQYADFAAWQRAWLAGEVLAAQIAYWRDALNGAPPLLDLPTDRPRPPIQTFRGARRALAFPSELAQSVRELGRSRGITSFMVLLATLQTLLHRTSGQPIVAVGSPIANRSRSEIEGLIGFFANTLVLAVDFAGEPSFHKVLDRVREAALGAYAHQDLPFEKLVEELAPQRNLAHAPLFQVLLTFQSAAGPAAAPLPAGGLVLSPVEADMAAAKFDLSLNVEERGAGLGAALEFNTDLFDPATAGRLLEHFRNLLGAALEAPQERISELPLLGELQRAQLLVEWNDTAPPIPSWGCLHELFAEQARREPGAPAVFAPEGTLTWSELADRVRQLAAYLRGLGIGPEVLVGICMERSLDLVVAILGTLEAGGAYLPLDPAYPRERLDFMLADAAAPVVLTQERPFGGLAIDEGADGPRWVCLDRDWPAIAAAPPAPPPGVTPDHLAYVIYTSGSTGRPKGVALAHRNAIALLRWASGIYPESDRAGVLASTSICFDLSVFELFLPLCFGGTVVLAENALQLPRLAAASRVTLVNTVPSAIAELVRGEGLPASVRTIVLAGEPLPRKLVDEIYAVQTIERVMNLYGPSEDTTYSTFATIDRSGGLPPIGRPVGEGRLYLLDAKLQPVPIGVPGELCLGGAGLARGYLNRAELTAEKFIPDPFSGEPGARLYRTGDLARFRPDGELLFLGRVDHQVKLRGFRIELGEIEATLRKHPGVAEALVVAKGEHGGDLRLIAYVVGREGTPPAVEELRGFLRAKLPAHMIPWAFVSLAAFPLNANGKIDRKALPDPERSAWGVSAELEEPRSEIERRIAAIWKDLLRLERVGIDDNFFDSGGHSLLAVRVYHQLKGAVGREFPLIALFEHPTIRALARYLEAGEAEPASRQRGQERGARRREAAGRRRPHRLASSGGPETDADNQEL